MDLGARPLARAAALLALTLLLAWSLAALGNALTRAGVAQQGLREWRAWHSGASPWQWRLRRPADVIAARAFGAASVHADDGALAVHYRGGNWQIGLRLARPAALTDAPVLLLSLRQSAALPLSVIVRSTLHARACTADAGLLPARAGTLRINLAALPWRCAGQPAPMPTRAAMLRLQSSGPAGGRIVLISAMLLPAQALSPQAPQTWAHWRAQSPPRAGVPVVWLPDTYSPYLLAQRDALWQRDPAAIALPVGAPARAGAARCVLPWDWIAIAACALLMLGLLRWPPHAPRPRALGEALLALLPVLLIAFGVGDSQRPDARSGALILLALGFALLLSVRRTPLLAPWHWLAPWRQWALPLLPVLAALLLWLAQPVMVPGMASFVRYLPWAALQQYLLLVIVARRLDHALAWRPLAVLLAALLFALAHTPNTPLMLLTFAAGLLWVGWFLRRGALLPVIVAHALGATLLLGIASDSGWLRSLATGGRYLGWGG